MGSENDALDQAYAAHLGLLFNNLVTGMTSNEAAAVDRFERGVEIARRALSLAKQSMVRL